MTGRGVIGMALAVLLALAVALATVWPAFAQAQMMCGERDKIAAAVKRSHSEEPVARGIASNGSVIEVFASPGGTFTIIMDNPGGLACLMTMGEAWEILPAALGPEA